MFSLSRLAHAASPAIARVALLLLIPASGALYAHGDAEADDFQNRLDEYTTEVGGLSENVDAIVADAAAGRDLDGAMDGLIDHWEEVGVHGAIELEATPLYPAIWQALVALRQALEAGADERTLRDRGDAVNAALWQGLGGLRLAASQVSATASADSEEGAASESPEETIAAIQQALDEAVAAYAGDDPERAESLIHGTYMNRFEGLEGDLIALDAALVSDLEEAFNGRLPLLMQRGADLELVREEVRGMKESLDRASELLVDAGDERSEVF